MVNPIFIVPLSVGLITILGGHIYLWYLKRQNIYRDEIKSEKKRGTVNECKLESPSIDADLNWSEVNSYATKTDLEMVSLKVENRLLKYQNNFERIFFILLIAILALKLNVL